MHKGRGNQGSGVDAAGASVSEVFRHALEPVRAVLLEYRIGPQTAAAVEADLAAWLIRYARRNPNASDEEKILALVSLASSFGRGYQARSGEPPADRKMAALLAQNPDAIAARVAAAFGYGTAPASGRSALWARVRELARIRPARRHDDRQD